MKISFRRPEACRLYSLLGHVMWLQQAVEAPVKGDAEELQSKLLEALVTFSAGIRSEMAYPGTSHWQCLNNLQDDVYHALTKGDLDVQEGTAALHFINDHHEGLKKGLKRAES